MCGRGVMSGGQSEGLYYTQWFTIVIYENENMQLRLITAYERVRIAYNYHNTAERSETVK